MPLAPRPELEHLFPFPCARLQDLLVLLHQGRPGCICQAQTVSQAQHMLLIRGGPAPVLGFATAWDQGLLLSNLPSQLGSDSSAKQGDASRQQRGGSRALKEAGLRLPCCPQGLGGSKMSLSLQNTASRDATCLPTRKPPEPQPPQPPSVSVHPQPSEKAGEIKRALDEEHTQPGLFSTEPSITHPSLPHLRQAPTTGKGMQRGKIRLRVRCNCFHTLVA